MKLYKKDYVKMTITSTAKMYLKKDIKFFVNTNGKYKIFI